MRIAISGSSSTGKTTLVEALFKQGVLGRFGLKVIWTDERAVLRAMGCQDMALMNVEQLCEFQRGYVRQKIDNETGGDDFITEHSYVDCAAYWVIRDQRLNAAEVSEDELTTRCRQMAGQYAMHIVLPFGAVPFHADGCRSTDMDLHRRIARQISDFLTAWQLPHVVVQAADLPGRVREVTRVLERIKGREGVESNAGPGSSAVSNPKLGSRAG